MIILSDKRTVPAYSPGAAFGFADQDRTRPT